MTTTDTGECCGHLPHPGERCSGYANCGCTHEDRAAYDERRSDEDAARIFAERRAAVDAMTCAECGTDDGGHTLECSAKLPLETCTGDTPECPHYGCPDGWHHASDAPNCSCTADCAIDDDDPDDGLVLIAGVLYDAETLEEAEA